VIFQHLPIAFENQRPQQREANATYKHEANDPVLIVLLKASVEEFSVLNRPV